MGEFDESAVTPEPERFAVDVDFPACIARAFPSTFDVSWQSGLDVIEVVKNKNMDDLARHSLGLLGCDWVDYLRCSVARAVRIASTLSVRTPAPASVLDLGSFLGNFSLLAARCGYEVEALDTYDTFGPCMSGVTDLLKSEDVRVSQPAEDGGYLADIADGSFDVVMCLSVIEHIPHSPKLLLLEIFRVLRPGGVLILDTPNVAYVFKRWQLARGESIYAPLRQQFHTPPPFEGHHREYTVEEIQWMLGEVGFSELATETFDYSRYGLTELSGDTLRGVLRSQEDWTAREMILCSAVKPVIDHAVDDEFSEDPQSPSS